MSQSFRFIPRLLTALLLFLVVGEGNSAFASRAKEKRKDTLAIRLAEREEQAAGAMDSVFAYAARIAPGTLYYGGDVFLKHNLYSLRSRWDYVRYLPGMLRLERGKHHYLTQAHLRFRYRSPGTTDCRIVAYHTTSPYQRAERFGEMGRFTFQLYDTKLFVDCILNPLHRRNRRYYRYARLFTRPGNDSIAPMMRISITPCFANDQLASGHIDVNLRTGAVMEFFLSFRYKLQKITVSGRPGREGRESLVPETLRVVSDFHLFKNRVLEVTEMNAHYDFAPQTAVADTLRADPYDATRLCMIHLDTARVVTDTAYFAPALSPIFSKEKENEALDFVKREAGWSTVPGFAKTQGAFAKYFEAEADTLPATTIPRLIAPEQSDALLARQVRSPLGDRTQDVIFSSHRFNLTRNGRVGVKLPPILTPSMVQWSGARGLSLKARVRFTLEPRDVVSSLPRLEVSPYVGYSFKQKQVYWQLPLRVNFLLRYNGTFSLESGGGSHAYSNRQADELRERVRDWEHYDTLAHIIDNFGFHDYRDSYTSADVAFSPKPGLRLNLGLRYHRRTLIEWNGLAADAGLTRRYITFGPRVAVEWTPGQYYYREGRNRIPLYSRFPTFIVAYERGFGMLRDKGAQYERLECDVRYRLPLYAMRTLYFRAGCGMFPMRGDDCFLDYDFFKFSYMPEGWTDEFTGEFQLLSSRWYNESRYYVRLTSTYESPMMVFSRIPGLTRVVQKERVYLNLLAVRALGLYTEMGYGVGTHLVDWGVFAGMAADHRAQFGFRFVLHFFDDK